jgi:hypothetical protein
MQIPLYQLTGLLQHQSRLVLLLPRTDRLISCTVQIGWSAKQDYQTTCTTQGWTSLISWTGQQPRSERQVCWRYQQAQLPREPLLDSYLLSAPAARRSPVLVACCADFGTTSSTVGAGLRLLSVAPPTVSQSSSPP